MKSLFVGNLNFQATESDLRAMFEPFGQIERVHIAMDRETGRTRGFGFVEMANDDDAKRAIASLDGKEVSGRNLTVNEARPRERSGPAGHDGRGGGKGRSGGGRGQYGGSRDDYRGAVRQPREPRW